MHAGAGLGHRSPASGARSSCGSNNTRPAISRSIPTASARDTRPVNSSQAPSSADQRSPALFRLELRAIRTRPRPARCRQDSKNIVRAITWDTLPQARSIRLPALPPDNCQAPDSHARWPFAPAPGARDRGPRNGGFGRRGTPGRQPSSAAPAVKAFRNRRLRTARSGGRTMQLEQVECGRHDGLLGEGSRRGQLEGLRFRHRSAGQPGCRHEYPLDAAPHRFPTPGESRHDDGHAAVAPPVQALRRPARGSLDLGGRVEAIHALHAPRGASGRHGRCPPHLEAGVGPARAAAPPAAASAGRIRRSRARARRPPRAHATAPRRIHPAARRRAGLR